jgi:hypothetical protein
MISYFPTGSDRSILTDWHAISDPYNGDDATTALVEFTMIQLVSAGESSRKNFNLTGNNGDSSLRTTSPVLFLLAGLQQVRSRTRFLVLHSPSVGAYPKSNVL